MSTSVVICFVCFASVQAALTTNSSAEELQNLLSTVNGILNSMGSSLEEMNTKMKFQIQNNAALQSTVESMSSLVNSACIPNDCPENWNKHGESCYKYSTCTRCSFDGMKRLCEGQNASLASVRSEKDNTFFASLSKLPYVCIGARQNTKGTWLWSDGSTLSYTNWGDDNSKSADNLKCVSIRKSYATWVTDGCDTMFAKNGFICEKKIAL